MLGLFFLFLALDAYSVSALVYSFPDCVNGPLKNNAVCDPTKDPATRANAVIQLFTVEELINNTVNTSPGVPRLGLPGYQWWSEALVRLDRKFSRTYPNAQSLAWCRIQPWRDVRAVRQFQLCDVLP
jgi:hypothetical protein